MSQRDLFPTRSSIAYDRYVQGLRDALFSRDWVYDPAFDLAQDPEIYVKIMRDPVAAHAIRFRLHLVAGPQWRIEPASDKPEDEAAAAVIEQLVKRIMGFTDARICLAQAIFRGSAYAYMSGRRQLLSIADKEPLVWWVPERLVDVDRRRFRLVNVQGRFVWHFYSIERGKLEPLEHPEWFVRSVFENTEDSLGYGRGLLGTLYYFQASKARVLQDSLDASERFGQGAVMVAVDQLRDREDSLRAGAERGGDTIADAYIDELEKHRARHIFVHDKADEISILTGLGEGWQLHDRLLKYFDNAQVTAVLGATLPTIEGDGGSRAMATVQENSTEALVQADRERLGEDLTRDLVGLVWRLNRFQIRQQIGPAAMPRLVIQQRKLEDPQASGQLVATLLASGVELRKDELYKAVGFTPPLPEDETVGGSVSGFPPPLAGLPSLPSLSRLVGANGH